MADEFKLPPDALEKLREANRKAKIADSAIRKAVAAGLPVGDMKKGLDEGRDQLNKIRDNFFPGEKL